MSIALLIANIYLGTLAILFWIGVALGGHVSIWIPLTLQAGQIICLLSQYFYLTTFKPKDNEIESNISNQ